VLVVVEGICALPHGINININPNPNPNPEKFEKFEKSEKCLEREGYDVENRKRLFLSIRIIDIKFIPISIIYNLP